jgi:D-tyrosyl-tRNA(Tyr) deacylase
MRLVVQRVRSAQVSVGGETIASIGQGLLVLAGVTHTDDADVAGRMADKVAGLRIFEDAGGQMNLSLADIGGAVLCVSQFTLYGDVRRGRRPSFDEAAPAASAQPLYDAFCAAIEARGIPCARGLFGAEMQVSLTNDGPVTLIIDSEQLSRPRRT